MSAAGPASTSLEQRVSALEAALALPSEKSGGGGPTSAEAAALTARVAALERALARSEYRVLHLARAYTAIVAPRADGAQ